MTILAVALIVAVAAILFVPVRVELLWDSTAESAKPRVEVQTRWLFLVWRSGTGRRRHPERAARPRRVTTSPDTPRGRRVRAVLTTPGFVPRVGRLVAESWRTLVPRAADGWVRFGFDDPVSTGVLLGAAHAAAGLVHAGGWTVRIEPDFGGATFAGRARLQWVLRPGAILWPVGTFIASPAVWRATLSAVRGRLRR